MRPSWRIRRRSESASQQFAFLRGSDPDLYRAFAELAIRISHNNGAIGMVYPRQLLAAKGSELYRKALFPAAAIIADFGRNRSGWMFPDAEHRYTIVALAAVKDGSATIDQAGPVTNEKAWSALPDIRTQWQYVDLKRFSEGAELPLFDDERGPKLFETMIVNGQPFSEPLDGVLFRPWAPIHATNDRKNGLLQEPGRGARGWPVYGGRNFYLWEPEVGEAAFVMDPRLGLEVLQRKRLRLRVWKAPRRRYWMIRVRYRLIAVQFCFSRWCPKRRQQNVHCLPCPPGTVLLQSSANAHSDRRLRARYCSPTCGALVASL